MTDTAKILIADGFAALLALLSGGFIGLLLWHEKSRASVVALGAGGAAATVMSLAATLLGQVFR